MSQGHTERSVDLFSKSARPVSLPLGLGIRSVGFRKRHGMYASYATFTGTFTLRPIASVVCGPRERNEM